MVRHRSVLSYGAVCSVRRVALSLLKKLHIISPAAFLRNPLFVLEHIVNYAIINYIIQI